MLGESRDANASAKRHFCTVYEDVAWHMTTFLRCPFCNQLSQRSSTVEASSTTRADSCFDCVTVYSPTLSLFSSLALEMLGQSQPQPQAVT